MEPTRSDLIRVAKIVWGEPSPGYSNGKEIRFGSRGSKSLDLEKRVWIDHEDATGGGWVDLYHLAHEPLPDDDEPKPTLRKIVATYDYVDEAGRLLFQAVRFSTGHPRFQQRQPDGRGDWLWNLAGVRRVLYRLPELLARDEDDVVWVPEGEKDVDRMRAAGLAATCNPMGAGKWGAEYCEALRGREVALLPDNDDPGRAHAAAIDKALAGIARSVTIVTLPGLPPKGDVSDWFNAGHSADELFELYRQTEPQPAAEAAEPLPDDPGPQQDAAPPLDVINPAKWQGLMVPERRWIVPWWIPFGVVSGLYGPPGHGKTLIMQQLMTATALSKPWLGQPTARIKSIAFLCEDDEDELHRRQEAINSHYQCDYADLRDCIRFVPRLGYDNVMMTFKDGRPLRTPFYDQVLSESLSFGAQLVIIDTVADTFGGDQNNMGHARQFVQGLAAIAREIKGGVMAAAHPSQHGKSSGSGESGSVQWDAALRSRAYLDTIKPENGETPDDDARILSRVKANYARKGETIPLRWQEGVFVSTAPSAGIVGWIERKKCERVFGDLLDRIISEGQRVSHNSRAGNYAPRIFAMRPDREGYQRADFERAMHALLAGREIKIGTYRDSFRRLIEHLERCSDEAKEPSC